MHHGNFDRSTSDMGESRPIDMTATRAQCPLRLQYCPFLFGEYRCRRYADRCKITNAYASGGATHTLLGVR